MRRLLLVLGVLLLPARVLATPAFVQQMASPSASATSPFNLTLPANSTIGNMLTVDCITRDTSGPVGPLPTLSGLATTWTVQADSGTGNDQRAIIWTGMVTSQGTVVAVTFSGGNSPKVSCSIQEWSGVNAVDQTSSTQNIGSGTITASLTTTKAAAVVLEIGGHNLSESPSAQPGAPWITLNSETGTVPQMDVVYQITSSVGTYSATWTWPSSIDNGAAAISLYQFTPGPALVQQMASPNAASVSPSPQVLPANAALGDFLTVECITRDATQGPLPTLSSVAPLAASWVLDADSGTGNNQRAIIWHAVVTAQGTTVNASFSGSTSAKISCSIQEWTLTNTLDRAAATENVTNSITASVTTVQPVDLMVAVGGHNSGETITTPPAAPWTALNGVTGSVPQFVPVYQVTSAAGSQSASWTWPSAIDNGAAIAGYYTLINQGAIGFVRFYQ